MASALRRSGGPLSLVAPAAAPVLLYTRVLRHFVWMRGLEVGLLQAAPFLGAYLAGFEPGGWSVARLGLLLAGSTALTAHVFVFNDWAGYDGQESVRVNGQGAITRDQTGRLAFGLLVLAAAILAAVGVAAVVLGAAIALLSVLYSGSSRLGKGTPGAASLNHLVGGALLFLLGYTMVRTVDARGVALGLFFGLVFAAGHLNQEIRDYDGDRAEGIRTFAVAHGRTQGFLLSLGLFTVAYALIIWLAAVGSAPEILLGSVVAWVLQVGWSLQALERGLGLETALWMQRRYRVLFALVGLAMLLR